VRASNRQIAASGDRGDGALTGSIDSSQSGGGGDDAATSSEGDEGDEDDDETGADRGSGEVLGTAQAELRANATDDRAVPLRIDVTRLERTGDLVELTLRVTNEAEVPSDGDEGPQFSADTRFGAGFGVDARYDTSAIGLVDAEQQMMYLPAYDAENVCLCSSANDVKVEPGESLTIEATYGGVPEGLEEVDVRIPDVPMISGVPIQ
jgi:hypothetical protein